MSVLFESAFCLTCCYLFYRFWLRGETFFQWNRVFLLLAPVVSLLLPCVEMHWQAAAPPPPVATVQETGWQEALREAQQWPQTWEKQWEAPVQVQGWSVADLLIALYQIGVLWMLGRLVVRYALLLRVLRRCRRIKTAESGIEGAVLAISEQQQLPLASFFSYIFWNPAQLTREQAQWALTHELAHVKQWHSADVVWMECLVAFQWFNPLMYAFRRNLRAVHEYIADEYVVRRTRQRHAYASLLVQQQTGAGASPGLFNTFHSLIQHRLMMLSKSPSRPLRRSKYLLSLPLFGSLFLLFSLRFVETLPAAAPLLQLTTAAENWAANLNEIVIIEKRIPASTSEARADNSCIFYWGAAQCRLAPLPGQHRLLEGTLYMDALRFADDLRKMPFLWDGTAMTEVFHFELRGIRFTVQKDKGEQFAEAASPLAVWSKGVQPGEQSVLSGLTLPDGRTARVTLIFTGRTDQAVQKSRVTTPLDWADERVGYSRLTAREFWEMLQASPLLKESAGSTEPASGVEVTVLPPEQDPVTYPLPYVRPASAREYAKNREVLERLREKLTVGSRVFIDMTIPPGTPNQPLAYAGAWTIVDSSDLKPLPATTGKAELRWGPVRFDLGEGVFERHNRETLEWKGAPKEFSRMLDVATAQEMLRSAPALWLSDTLYERPLRLTLDCNSAQYVVGNKHPLPEEAYKEVLERIQQGHQLLVLGNNTAFIGLRKVHFRFYVPSSAPVSLLSKSKEQAVRQPEISVQPNPATTRISLKIALPETCTATLLITNEQGQIVHQEQRAWEGGTSHYTLQNAAWMQTSGRYFISLQSPSGNTSCTLIRQ